MGAKVPASQPASLLASYVITGVVRVAQTQILRGLVSNEFIRNGWKTRRMAGAVGGWTMMWLDGAIGGRWAGGRRMVFLSFQIIWGGTVALLYIFETNLKN